MLELTILVAVLLFGVLGPWLMGRLDRFLAEAASGLAPEERLPAKGRKRGTRPMRKRRLSLPR